MKKVDSLPAIFFAVTFLLISAAALGPMRQWQWQVGNAVASGLICNRVRAETNESPFIFTVTNHCICMHWGTGRDKTPIWTFIGAVRKRASLMPPAIGKRCHLLAAAWRLPWSLGQAETLRCSGSYIVLHPSGMAGVAGTLIDLSGAAVYSPTTDQYFLRKRHMRNGRLSSADRESVNATRSRPTATVQG